MDATNDQQETDQQEPRRARRARRIAMISASRRPLDKNASLLLIAGFGMVILFLLVSGYLGILAMEDAEANTSSLLEEQQLSSRLIDQIQGLEASLSSVFYQLVSSEEPDRAALLVDLNAIEMSVGKTLQAAKATPGGGRWSNVDAAVDAYIGEMRRTLKQPAGGRAASSLIDSHEHLVSELARLVLVYDDETILARRQDDERSRQLLQRSLMVQGLALALAMVCAAGTVFAAMRMVRRVDWQAQELSRLSGHVLEKQETVIRRFSRELHDEFGQTLTAIEATLVAFPSPTREQRDQLEDCQLLVKDAISKTREMSQLMRPSVLDDFGLCTSLQSLADSFRQRTGIVVRTALEFEGRLPEGTETHLFRIAQEALTNVARHSKATSVELTLRQQRRLLTLQIRDDGRGLPDGLEPSGFGLIGMRERAAAIGGSLDVESGPRGVTIRVEAPFEQRAEVATHTSPARG